MRALLCIIASLLLLLQLPAAWAAVSVDPPTTTAKVRTTTTLPPIDIPTATTTEAPTTTVVTTTVATTTPIPGITVSLPNPVSTWRCQPPIGVPDRLVPDGYTKKPLEFFSADAYHDQENRSIFERKCEKLGLVVLEDGLLAVLVRRPLFLCNMATKKRQMKNVGFTTFSYESVPEYASCVEDKDNIADGPEYGFRYENYNGVIILPVLPSFDYCMPGEEKKLGGTDGRPFKKIEYDAANTRMKITLADGSLAYTNDLFPAIKCVSKPFNDVIFGAACGCPAVSLFTTVSAAYCPTTVYPTCDTTAMKQDGCSVYCPQRRAMLNYRNSTALWQVSTAIHCLPGGNLTNGKGARIANLMRPTCGMRTPCNLCEPFPLAPVEFCTTLMWCTRPVEGEHATSECLNLMCEAGSRLVLFDSAGNLEPDFREGLTCTMLKRWMNYTLDGGIGTNKWAVNTSAVCRRDFVCSRQIPEYARNITSQFKEDYFVHSAEGFLCPMALVQWTMYARNAGFMAIHDAVWNCNSSEPVGKWLSYSLGDYTPSRMNCYAYDPVVRKLPRWKLTTSKGSTIVSELYPTTVPNICPDYEEMYIYREATDTFEPFTTMKSKDATTQTYTVTAVDGSTFDVSFLAYPVAATCRMKGTTLPPA